MAGKWVACKYLVSQWPIQGVKWEHLTLFWGATCHGGRCLTPREPWRYPLMGNSILDISLGSATFNWKEGRKMTYGFGGWCEWTCSWLDGQGQGQCHHLHFRSPTYLRQKYCSGLSLITWVKLQYVWGIPSRERVELRLRVDGIWPTFPFKFQPGKAWLTTLDQDWPPSWGFLRRLDIPSRWTPAQRKHSNRFQTAWEGPGETKSIVLIALWTSTHNTSVGIMFQFILQMRKLKPRGGDEWSYHPIPHPQEGSGRALHLSWLLSGPFFLGG